MKDRIGLTFFTKFTYAVTLKNDGEVFRIVKTFERL